jgi:hypothetical protein
MAVLWCKSFGTSSLCMNTFCGAQHGLFTHMHASNRGRLLSGQCTDARIPACAAHPSCGLFVWLNSQYVLHRLSAVWMLKRVQILVWHFVRGVVAQRWRCICVYDDVHARIKYWVIAHVYGQVSEGCCTSSSSNYQIKP